MDNGHNLRREAVDTETDSIGYRVAMLRKLAGMTQDQLAHAAHVSVSLVRAVEQGRTPASPSFTAAAAKALGLDVTTLTRQPYEDLVSDPRSEAATIPALRQALSEHDNPVDLAEPLDTDELSRRLQDARLLRYAGRNSQLCEALPEILRSLYVHWARPISGRSRELLAELLDDAYSLAQVATYRFGYLDLAAQVDDRRLITSVATGDPLRIAGAEFVCTDLPMHRGDYDGCTRRLDRAMGSIEGDSGDVARAVRGQLHLRAAVVAARAARGDDADAHIGEARDLLTSGVPSHPYLDINSSQVNLDAHYVAIPVELADGTTAVSRAETVTLPEDDLSERYRVGHHWIDVSRAWVLHGNRHKALDALNKARYLCPQQTRYHPSVRETVHAIAEADRRATDSLTGFARWAGVTI